MVQLLMGTIASRFFAIAASMWIPCLERSFQGMPFQTPSKDDTMHTELCRIEGVWLGHLAIMPRPRGGDWLEDEIQTWRESGVDIVVSLLTREEQTELNLADEEAMCRASGIEFISFPIVDRGIPFSYAAFLDLMSNLSEQLANEKNIAIHCRQGIGRAALIAICLLILSGIEVGAAIERVGAARGCSVPETPEQRRWIIDFARSLAAGLSK